MSCSSRPLRSTGALLWCFSAALLLSLVLRPTRGQTISSSELLMEYDYIVVGAGVAGGVVASRLAQRVAHRGETVLVLETGKDESHNPLLQPSYFFKDTKLTHLYRNYFSQEGTNLNNRRLLHMNAKAMGGGSAINAMCWTWGDIRDWELWTEATGGLPGWSFEDVKPYFQRVETWEMEDPSGLRGMDGPVHVSMYTPNNISLAAIETGARVLDTPAVFDNNAGVHEGIALLQRNVRGSQPLTAERQSSWVSYLQSAAAVLPRSLHVLSRATATKVVIEVDGEAEHLRGGEGSVKRATAVDFLLDGRCMRVAARKEIILSAGAHNTPKLLLLSGVGNFTELKAVGVEPVHELVAVGKDMLDHINPGSLIYLGPPRDDYDGNLVAGYGRTGEAEEMTPDVEYGFIMGPASLDPRAWPFVPSLHMFYCLMLNNDARGSITLYNADPLQDPIIESGYFKTDLDLRRVVTIFRNLMRWSAEMNKIVPITQATSGPYALTMTPDSTDEEIIAEIRGTTDTHWHVAATAKMGPASNPRSVVDEHFKVHGISGLRVVDASAMPVVPNGHPQAAIMMIAERAAEWIAEGR